MARNNYENIERIGELLTETGIPALQREIGNTERKLSEILKKLSDKENEIKQKRAEEALRKAEEEKKAAEENKKAEEEAKEAAPVVEVKVEEPAPVQEEVQEEVKQPKMYSYTPLSETNIPPIRPSQGERKPYDRNANQGERKPFDRNAAQSERKPYDRNANQGERKPYDRNAAQGERKPYDRNAAQGERKPYDRNAAQGERKPFDRNAAQGERKPFDRNAAQGERKPFDRPAAPRNDAPNFNVEAIAAEANKKNFGEDKKKKTFEKPFNEKKPMNKRAMIRQEGLDVDDFDEDKSGYRKARFGKKEVKKKEIATVKIEHAVVTTKDIPLKVLSEKLGISAVEITKKLFKEGIMKGINDSIDYETAASIAMDMDIDLEYNPPKTAEDILSEEHDAKEANSENLVTRAPVVTVMGHVDHGKTSLLDAIRHANVTAGEAGGITQNIGAYTVTANGKQITFIDTPGHAAFTAMRARGAKVTDIVILVVAGDDGIMPQTVEAINHAKAANVPIIVAMNKMDKPQADPDRVKKGLLEHNLVPEEWGGDTIIVPVSAKTGMGIDDLLENITLVAEMQELKANPNRMAKGTIIEAKLDKGKGPVASVIIENGTLRTGDNIISGTTMGRVRAMFDDKNRAVKEAGPSMAVNVLGLEEVPSSGDSIFAVEQALMKQVLEERENQRRESMIKAQSKVTLDDVFAQVAEGKMKTLNLIVKADVQGSVEAVDAAMVKLSNEEVNVKVIHSAAGAITESDVMLADSANAIIIGFNVRPDSKARALADSSKVDIRMYRIIYELIDDMEAALKGMLSPKYQEIYMGKCEVRQTFNISGVGVVAGCYVTDGKIVRGGKLRIYRDDVMIVEGNVKTLKRFKDEVKEVSFGFECGCAIDGFDKIQIGDMIECYMIQEVAR